MDTLESKAAGAAPRSAAITGKRIVFVHVPKTAGKGLLNAMRDELGVGFGGLKRQHAKLREPSSLSDIEHYKAVGGHIDWYDLEQVRVPTASFAILRNGRERLASMYFFALNNAGRAAGGGRPDNDLHRAIRSIDADRFFLEQASAHRYDNVQAYYFATRRFRRLPGDLTDIPRGEVVPRAVENAKRLDLVTGIDRLADIEAFLEREAGVRLSFATERVNEGPIARGESRWEALMALLKSAEARARVERMAELDVAFLEALKL